MQDKKDEVIKKLERTAAFLAQCGGHRFPPGFKFYGSQEDAAMRLWDRACTVYEMVEGHPPHLEDEYTTKWLRDELSSIIAIYGVGRVFVNTPEGPQSITSVDVHEDTEGSVLISWS